MKITKCDLCKKKIKGEPITAGVGFFPKAELCEKCGAPILNFLKKHKFIESKKIKRGNQVFNVGY
jgi:ribosome-binding protein aMBF1 (putative translation factor)